MGRTRAKGWKGGLWGIFLVLLCINFSKGQNWLVNRQLISPKDGLVSRYILDICQDSLGFIWLATSEGVQRFDGYDFKLFRRETHGLSTNEPQKILQGPKGLIWIISTRIITLNQVAGWESPSIDLLDPVTERVRSFDEYFSGKTPFAQKEIFGLQRDRNGRLWIGTRSHGIFCYDGNFRRFPSGRQPVSLIWPASAHSLWVVGTKALLEINDRGDTLNRESLPAVPRNIRPAGVDGILLTVPSGTEGGSVFWYKRPGAPVRDTYPGISQVIDIQKMLGISIDLQGRLWGQDQTTIYMALPDGSPPVEIPLLDAGRFLQSGVFFLDADEQLWFSFGRDLHLINIRPKLFKTYLANSGFSIRGIAPLDSRRLLINTYQGTVILDRETGKFTRILPVEAGLGLWKDADGSIWSGVHSAKVLRYREKAASIDVFPVEGRVQNQPSSQVNVIRRDELGNYWLGLDDGLGRLDTATKGIQRVVLSGYQRNAVRWIEPDGQVMWLGTQHGLFRFDPLTRQANQVIDVPDTEISHIYLQGEQKMWLATRGLGLLCWDRDNNVVNRYGIEQGFSSNIIYAVYEGGKGGLWLPSQNGLMKFDQLSHQVTTFFVRDGLPEDEFNYLAHARLPDNTLAFGGLNGIINFHPDSLLAQSPLESDQLVITQVNLLNAKTGEMEDNFPEFSRNLRIEVPSRYSSINIRLALLHFQQLRKNSYAYRIRGLEKDWIYLEDHIIRLGRLPYGRYLLEIKAQGSNGQWILHRSYIPLWIIRPWYFRWWAWVFWCGACLGLVALIIRERIRLLERDKKNLDAEVARRTAQIEKDKAIILRQYQELDRLSNFKDRLFTIIGHELRGPLIGLQGIVDKIDYLVQQGDMPRARLFGSLADDATRKMRLLIDNILSWGRADQSSMFYRPDYFNPAEIIEEAVEFHQRALDAKEISCRLTAMPDATVFMDKNALRIIALNLLSNAIKFTPNGGRIAISIRTEDPYTTLLEVRDSGVGMSPSLIREINEGRYGSRPGTQNEKGVGIGLMVCRELVRSNKGNMTISSTEGEGSLFSLWFPATEAALEKGGASPL